MTPRHSRALRGAAAAWTATVVAATAHTLAGHGAPSLVLVAAIAVLASPLAVALAGRRLSAWRVGATVLASQALLHVAFSLTAGTGGLLPSGHHVHALTRAVPAEASLLIPDAPMLLAHLVAAVATTIALHRGERMLRALGRGIRLLLSPAAVEAALATPEAPKTSLPQVRPLLRARDLLSDVSRRGPPAMRVATA